MDKSADKQSGGVNISGGTVVVSGDIVGRDNTVETQIDGIFRLLAEAVHQHAEARRELEALKKELAKGNSADDGIVSKLVKGVIGLVPGAVSAVVGAFASPILSGIAGPATRYVLDEIQHKNK